MKTHFDELLDRSGLAVQAGRGMEAPLAHRLEGLSIKPMPDTFFHLNVNRMALRINQCEKFEHVAAVDVPAMIAVETEVLIRVERIA